MLGYIGLGSNLGGRVSNCRMALEMIDAAEGCHVLRSSGWYETEPVGMESSNLFINAVAEIETVLAPANFMKLLLEVEKELGRERGACMMDRTVDLDLLYLQGIVIGYPHDFKSYLSCGAGMSPMLPDKNRRLVIPHPAIPERRFVLEPWAELAPELVVEPWGVSVSEMLDALSE